MFLSLVSLITLIVGAIGVATAIHAHIQQRLDSIAIMKCLGARSLHLMRIYVIQTVALGLAGGLLGVAFGFVVQKAFPAVSGSATSRSSPPSELDFVTAAQGIGIAVLATLLFTLPPLLGIRRIRPNLILRREMAETKPGWRERLIQERASILAGVCIVIGVAGIAMSFTAGTHANMWRIGEYFTGALVGGIAGLSGDRLAHAARLARVGPLEPAGFGAARHRQLVPARQSCRIRAGGARHGRDVHSHRLPDRTRRDRADESQRAARNAERLPARHRAGQIATRCSTWRSSSAAWRRRRN